MLPDPLFLLREITAMGILRDYSPGTTPDPRNGRHQIEVSRPAAHIRPVQGVRGRHVDLVHRRRDGVVDGGPRRHLRRKRSQCLRCGEPIDGPPHVL